MKQIRPNALRARNARLMVLIVTIIQALMLISALMQFNMLQQAIDGAELTIEEANLNDLRELWLNIAYLITFIISGFTFILWFRRAYYNLDCKTSTLSYTTGMAAGAWFIPIINLWRPYQVMRELYTETNDLFTIYAVSNKPELPTHFIGLWWTLWIVSGIINRVDYQFSRYAETLTELSEMTISSIINCSVGIILGIITLKVIKDYNTVEPLLADLNTVSDNPTLQSN